MLSIIEQLIANVDAIILLFVQGSFGALSTAIGIFWRIMFIIFIAVFGYKVIISGRFSASDLLTNIIKIIVILAIATEWDTFFLLVYDIVTDLPADIAGEMITTASNSLGGTPVDSVDNANLALSLYYDRTLSVVEEILEGSDWLDFGVYLYAGAVALVCPDFLCICNNAHFTGKNRGCHSFGCWSDIYFALDVQQHSKSV